MSESSTNTENLSLRRYVGQFNPSLFTLRFYNEYCGINIVGLNNLNYLKYSRLKTSRVKLINRGSSQTQPDILNYYDILTDSL